MSEVSLNNKSLFSELSVGSNSVKDSEIDLKKSYKKDYRSLCDSIETLQDDINSVRKKQVSIKSSNIGVDEKGGLKSNNIIETESKIELLVKYKWDLLKLKESKVFFEEEYSLMFGEELS